MKQGCFWKLYTHLQYIMKTKLICPQNVKFPPFSYIRLLSTAQFHRSCKNKCSLQSALKINTDLGYLDRVGSVFKRQGSSSGRKLSPNGTETILPLSKSHRAGRSVASGSAGAHQETQFWSSGPSTESIFLPAPKHTTSSIVNTICHRISAAKLWPQDTGKPHLDNLACRTTLWFPFYRIGNADAFLCTLIISKHCALKYCDYFRQHKRPDDSAEGSTKQLDKFAINIIKEVHDNMSKR